MKIQKKRILNPDRYISWVGTNNKFYIALKNAINFSSKLQKIGFTKKLDFGEDILPTVVGKATERNAEGFFVKLKNLPKKTVYRQMMRSWKDWRGNEHSGIVSIPYRRYQRQNFPPYDERIKLISLDEQKTVISGTFVYDEDKNNQERIRNTINMFLECFGECEIIDANKKGLVSAKEQRLDWDILPPGKQPWSSVKKNVEKAMKKSNLANGIQEVMTDRFKHINSFEPELHAYGKNGFSGYVILGFPSKSVYILESTKMYNATYVLDGDDWEELTKLTKAELINEKLHKARIIHNKDWNSNISNLFD